MKILQSILLGSLLVAFGCEEGYIDDITAVDSGPDQSAPDVKITSPTGDIFIPFTDSKTDVNFKFEASDDIEVKSVSVSLNGEVLETFTSFPDYRNAQASLLKESLPVGAYSLEVKAEDLSGKSAVQILNFKVTNEYVARAGEVFYMPFEGGVYLDLITETEATTGGNPGFAPGVSKNALSLDVSSQSYLLFPGDAFAAVESFTLSFWVNPKFVDADDDGGIDGVLGLVNLSNVNNFWGNLDFFVENGSNPTAAKMRIHITNGTAETWITDVNDVPNFFGEWSNHILTYDATTSEFKYYINGALATSATAAWTGPLAFTNSGPMVLGTVHFQTNPSSTSATGSQPWASYLTGELDEIRIFNIPLSAEEVSSLYESEKP